MSNVVATNEQVCAAFEKATEHVECPKVIATGEPFKNSVDEGFFDFLETGEHLTDVYIADYYAAQEACA